MARFASQRLYHEPARWSVIAPAFSASNGEKCPLLLLASPGQDSRIMRNCALHRRMYPVRRSFLFHLICAARHIARYLYSASVGRAMTALLWLGRPCWFGSDRGDLAGSWSVCKHGCAASRRTPPSRLQFSRGSPGVSP